MNVCINHDQMINFCRVAVLIVAKNSFNSVYTQKLFISNLAQSKDFLIHLMTKLNKLQESLKRIII